MARFSPPNNRRRQQHKSRRGQQQRRSNQPLQERFLLPFTAPKRSAAEEEQSISFSMREDHNNITETVETKLYKLTDTTSPFHIVQFFDDFDKARLQFQWTTGPRLFRRFNSLVTGTRHTSWLEQINGLGETVNNFDDSIAAFEATLLTGYSYSDHMTRVRNMKLPPNMLPSTWINSFRAYVTLICRLPDAPAVPGLGEEEAMTIFHAMPEKWQSEFRRSTQRPEAQTVEAFQKYFDDCYVDQAKEEAAKAQTRAAQTQRLHQLQQQQQERRRPNNYNSNNYNNNRAPTRRPNNYNNDFRNNRPNGGRFNRHYQGHNNQDRPQYQDRNRYQGRPFDNRNQGNQQGNQQGYNQHRRSDYYDDQQGNDYYQEDYDNHYYDGNQQQDHYQRGRHTHSANHYQRGPPPPRRGTHFNNQGPPRHGSSHYFESHFYNHLNRDPDSYFLDDTFQEELEPEMFDVDDEESIPDLIMRYDTDSDDDDEPPPLRPRAASSNDSDDDTDNNDFADIDASYDNLRQHCQPPAARSRNDELG